MTRLNREDQDNLESSTEVLCVSDVASAEMIRLILAMSEIRAAVIHRDPLRAVAASAEILVATADLARAQDAIEDSLFSEGEGIWKCPTCGEPVPKNFNVCWNCESSEALDPPNRSFELSREPNSQNQETPSEQPLDK